MTLLTPRSNSRYSSSLPPGCRIVDGVLSVNTSWATTALMLALVVLFAGMFWFLFSFTGSAGLAAPRLRVIAPLSDVALLECLLIWYLSIWRGYRFDLRRRVVEQTVVMGYPLRSGEQKSTMKFW